VVLTLITREEVDKDSTEVEAEEAEVGGAGVAAGELVEIYIWDPTAPSSGKNCHQKIRREYMKEDSNLQQHAPKLMPLILTQDL
jgi:hypothetical protein